LSVEFIDLRLLVVVNWGSSIAGLKDITGSFLQLPFPVVDHRGMNLILACQLGYGSLTPNRGKGNFSFELSTVLFAFICHELPLS
jgi:hypothetical protein